MYYGQRSLWELSPQSDSSRNDEQREAKRKPGQVTHHSQWCSCCSSPILTGLLIGLLSGGIALVALLILYFHRGVVSNTICSTMTSEALSTTAMITSAMLSTTTAISSTASVNTAPALNVNLVVDGDAETSPCASDHSVSSPVGWNFSGPISQYLYTSSVVNDQSLSSPGPSNRGQCYFYGQSCASTSMWQTINLNGRIDPVLIDNQTIQFNLSAWLGGTTAQDDSGTVSLTFLDTNNQYVVPTTNISVSLGPVLANERNNRSSLIFQQTNGYVPVTTRSMLLLVTLNRVVEARNNGNIDNIALYLY